MNLSNFFGSYGVVIPDPNGDHHPIRVPFFFWGWTTSHVWTADTGRLGVPLVDLTWRLEAEIHMLLGVFHPITEELQRKGSTKHVCNLSHTRFSPISQKCTCTCIKNHQVPPKNTKFRWTPINKYKSYIVLEENSLKPPYQALPQWCESAINFLGPCLASRVPEIWVTWVLSHLARESWLCKS